MSKMMDELNNLSESRKIQNGIVIEDASKNQEQIQIVREHKGIYVLSFLIIVLIALSASSLSASLKMFAQLETSLTDSKIILHTLNQHGVDIKFLETLIIDNTSAELARIDGLKNQMNDQMNELNIAIKGREKEFDDMRIAHNDLKASIQDSVYELKMSDKLMLEKYIRLNERVEKLNDANSFILNAY